MKTNILTVGLITAVVFFGGIGVSMATGLWSTTSDKTPAKIKEGYAAGSYNPEDIRGSYTFQEIATLFDIDLNILYQAFNIPKNTDGTKIKSKDVKTLYESASAEIGNESIQIFVALYQNLPIDLDDTVIPKNAAKLILQKNNQLSDEQKTYLQTHTIDLDKVSQNKESIFNNLASNSSEESDALINGSTTFQKALDAGITKKEIEKIINASMPPSNLTIRDYCMENGLSFSSVKDQLNKLIE